MGYSMFADAVMLVHFGFLAFVVAGGFLAWRWPWVIWAHVTAALWGLGSISLSIRCPLTNVEDWARLRAGQEKLGGTGFIDHYIENVVYPEEYSQQLQAAVASAVFVSWLGFAWLRRRPASQVVSPPPIHRPDVGPHPPPEESPAHDQDGAERDPQPRHRVGPAVEQG